MNVDAQKFAADYQHDLEMERMRLGVQAAIENAKLGGGNK